VGVQSQGCQDVMFTGCDISNNVLNIKVISSTYNSVKLVNKFVLFTGCIIGTDGQSDPSIGIDIESTLSGGTDQTEVHVVNCTGVVSMLTRSDAPLIYYITKPNASGVRFRTTGGATAAWGFRWYVDSATGVSGMGSMALTGKGQLATAGRRLNVRLVSASATVTDQDEVITVNNQTAPVTITLPDGAAVGQGATYLIKDLGGLASSQAITVKAAGTGVIDGVNTKTIAASYGQIRVMSLGINSWAVIDTAVTQTWTGTKGQYDLLPAKDNSTIYVIKSVTAVTGDITVDEGAGDIAVEPAADPVADEPVADPPATKSTKKK